MLWSSMGNFNCCSAWLVSWSVHVAMTMQNLIGIRGQNGQDIPNKQSAFAFWKQQQQNTPNLCLVFSLDRIKFKLYSFCTSDSLIVNFFIFSTLRGHTNKHLPQKAIWFNTKAVGLVTIFLSFSSNWKGNLWYNYERNNKYTYFAYTSRCFTVCFFSLVLKMMKTEYSISNDSIFLNEYQHLYITKCRSPQ